MSMPETLFERFRIPQVVSLLEQLAQELQSGLPGGPAAQAMATTATGSASTAPAVVQLSPLDFDNLLDVLVAGGLAESDFLTDYVSVGANSTATLTISVNPNQVLLVRGSMSVAPFTQNSGLLATVTFDGISEVASAAPLLDTLPFRGAQLPPASAAIDFSFQNTTSSALTAFYQAQGVLVNKDTWLQQILPKLQTGAAQALA